MESGDMRLNKYSKSIVMGNIQLLEYCSENRLNINTLKHCEVEKMENEYYFVYPKSYVSLEEAGDIGSQPDVVLIMDISETDEYKFTETECTERILRGLYEKIDS
jgi:hypothetical protein